MKLTNDIAKMTLANATLRSSVDPAGRIDFMLIQVYGYILCAKVSDLPYLTVFEGLTGASRCNGPAYETSSLREIRPLESPDKQTSGRHQRSSWSNHVENGTPG